MDPQPRILGVDDSLTIRKALEIVLKPAGYDLELAADGAEALAKAKTLQPALILLDFILPDLRGTDVCRQLAADPETAHIPVVLISAKGAEIEQAYRDVSNVVSYIAKPFKPPVLTGVVAEVLARAAAGDLVKLGVPAQSMQPSTTPSPALAPPTSAPESQPWMASERATAAVEADADRQAVSANGAHTAEEIDDIDGDEMVSNPLDDAIAATARRDRIEWMFETLRSSLEGVYVEEVDTPTGAAADQAKTHTDLIEQLSQQLEEGLQHAHSGARYRLYGDGSIRAFDEALLDVFRRSCRVLFRAAASSAGTHETTTHAERVLIASPRHGRVYEQLQTMLAAHPDWSVVVVAENFRQLPLLVRLYAPSQLVAEMTWTGALWDQLRTIQRMPEAHAMRTIGIADPAQLSRLGAPDGEALAAQLAQVGCTSLAMSVFEVESMLSGHELAQDDQAPDAHELLMAV